jgi:hypothetical protein
MNHAGNNSINLGRLPMRAGLVGGVLLALCIVAGLRNSQDFFRSYLIAFLFWIGVTLGCLALLMTQYLAGGRWSVVVRRILEAATRTLPLMALAVLPLVGGMRVLYAWSRPGETDPLILAKRFYLNSGFYIGRLVFYFAVWFLLTYLLDKWSKSLDRSFDVSTWVWMQNWCAAGLLLYGLTITFASIDWVMSLEPHWFSTIYGLIFMVSEALTAMAFIITMLVWLSGREPLRSVVTPSHFQDLGGFLLTFVMLWAYLDFSQFLIIWGGNLSDEIPWYVRRMRGGWGWIGVGLIVVSFFLPFFLLLFRYVKRRRGALLAVAGIVLAMRLVDMYWMVLPAFGGGIHITWMNVALPFGLGGIWFAYFGRQLEKLPILPVNDPRMKGEAEHAVEHG